MSFASTRPSNIEVEDQSLSVLLYLPTQNHKKLQRNRLLYACWLTNLSQFQGVHPNHVQVESSCCRFPRDLVSFVLPGELASFARPRELMSFVRPKELVSFARPR